MKRTKKHTAVKRSLSIPKSLLGSAERRAEAEGRNLSNYIQRLITMDIATESAAAEPKQEVGA